MSINQYSFPSPEELTRRHIENNQPTPKQMSASRKIIKEALNQYPTKSSFFFANVSSDCPPADCDGHIFDQCIPHLIGELDAFGWKAEKGDGPRRLYRGMTVKPKPKKRNR
jgi:hypothetical protein